MLMKKRKIRLAAQLLVCVAAFAALMYLCRTKTVQADNSLVLAFAEAQQQARDKITSFTLEMTESYQKSNSINGFSSEVTHTQTSQGCCVNIRRVDQIRVNESGETQELDDRLVLNEEYLATFGYPGTAHAYMWEHESIDSISEYAKEHLVGLNPRNPMWYGFTVDTRDLADMYDPARDDLWEVLEQTNGATGSTKYLVRHYSNTEPRWLYLEIVVDPSKAFLMTHVTRFWKNGNVLREIDVDLEEVAPGIWFPMAYEQTYHNKAGGKETTSRNVVTSLQVNIQVDPALFQWQALDMAPETNVMRTDVSGETEVFFPVDGELYPWSVVQRWNTE